MMRGGAMRNRAPRFFVAHALWLRFVAHFFASRRMRGIRGNFEHESHEFREKVFWGPHAECAECAEIFWEHESGEWHEFFGSLFLAHAEYAEIFCFNTLFLREKYTKIVDLENFLLYLHQK